MQPRKHSCQIARTSNARTANARKSSVSSRTRIVSVRAAAVRNRRSVGNADRTLWNEFRSGALKPRFFVSGAEMPDGPHLAKPDICLYGSVDDAMFHDFQDKLNKVPEGRPVVVELMTFGGDADVGRRIALEVRLARKRTGQDFFFLGKTVVYSSGVTIMAAFPRANRYLTRDTVLLIHGRRMDKHIHFTGSLSTSIQIAKDMLAQLEIGVRLEREGFVELIAGSDVGEEEIFRLAETSWYLSAEEALSRGLIAGIL